MNNNVPIGIENYKEAQNYYYVDKTLLIDEIINSMIGKSILVTRPRRFGKSLVVSMLEYFFSNNEKSDDIFKDKAIYNCPTSYAHINKYPTIHINMKNVNGENKDELITKCINEISNLYRKHDYLLDSVVLSKEEKDYFNNVLSTSFNDYFYYQDSIKKLSSFLYNHFKHKVVILIDEYDTPIESSYENNFFNETITFFKELYSNSLKGNDNVFFCFITGVLEISKESLFSGLNNLSVFSVIDNKLNAYFGFTEDEARTILKNFGLDEQFEDITKWYSGYIFGNRTLFNPWSLLNYVERQQIRSYWINTGSNNLIGKLLEPHIKDDFLSFINNESLEIDFNNSINYDDFQYDNTAIYSYLVQSGYLVAEYKKAPKSYVIKIPNAEIYECFKNDVIAKGFNKSLLSIATQLRNAILNKKVADISNILENYVIESFSYYDLKNEKSYQILLTGILATLFDTHVVKTEVNNLKGRCDIMISPKMNDDIGIIVEVKCHNGKTPLSKTKLNESAISAIKQIEKNNYYSELKRRGCQTILLYGISFDINGNHIIEVKELKIWHYLHQKAPIVFIVFCLTIYLLLFFLIYTSTLSVSLSLLSDLTLASL